MHRAGGGRAGKAGGKGKSKTGQLAKVVDPTGAGDSFAGGLAYGYLAYQDYVVACQYGNAMGAQRCTGTELKVYLPREETERQIREAYGPRNRKD